jgi:hypothetical protein
MNNHRTLACFAAALLAGGALVGCTSSSATKVQKQQNNLSATEASEFSSAVPYPYANAAPTDPLERENLATRLKDQNSKSSTAYVYLFTYSGQVLGYYVIKGKVSSTGSEMTATQVNVDCSNSNANAACTDDAIGDDGSYGPEEGGQNGVFFITAGSNVLIETVLPWVSSTEPIKLYASAPELDAPVAK